MWGNTWMSRSGLAWPPPQSRPSSELVTWWRHVAHAVQEQNGWVLHWVHERLVVYLRRCVTQERGGTHPIMQDGDWDGLARAPDPLLQALLIRVD